MIRGSVEANSIVAGCFPFKCDIFLLISEEP